MGWDRERGCNEAGTHGRGHHLGEPLTCQQIRDLPDGAEVMITWSGGNGPWPYRILVDALGERRVENLYPDPILGMDLPDHPQTAPLHRVTRGWDDEAREWAASKIPEPAHIRETWATLRGATSRL